MQLSQARRGEYYTGSTKDDCAFLDSYYSDADEDDEEEEVFSDELCSANNIAIPQRPSMNIQLA